MKLLLRKNLNYVNYYFPCVCDHEDVPDYDLYHAYDHYDDEKLGVANTIFYQLFYILHEDHFDCCSISHGSHNHN